MPVFGELQVRSEPQRVPTIDPGATEPLAVQSVQIFQAIIEAKRADLLRLTPEPFHPTNPTAVALTVIRARESNIGPFDYAHAGVVCRAGARLRSFTASTIASTPEAEAVLRDRWGYRTSPGVIRLYRHYDRVRAVVEEGTSPVLDVSLTKPVMLSASDISFIDYMNLADTPAGRRLVQVDPSYSIHSAIRGKPVVDAIDTGALLPGPARLSLPVAAVLIEGEMTLPRIRFLCRTDIPAIDGTECLS